VSVRCLGAAGLGRGVLREGVKGWGADATQAGSQAHSVQQHLQSQAGQAPKVAKGRPNAERHLQQYLQAGPGRRRGAKGQRVQRGVLSWGTLKRTLQLCYAKHASSHTSTHTSLHT